MRRTLWPAWPIIAGLAGVSVACLGTAAAAYFHPRAQPIVNVELQRVEVVAQLTHARDPFDSLRKRLHWVPAKVGRETLMAPDYESRMLLSKAAAQQAELSEVGLSFKDVYAIINAETSWVPRTGASRDGTPNLGLAQFEPATAKALGLSNPEDPVAAVHAAALYIKEAALWSRDRIRPLKLSKSARAEKLREGVSIYYNLSTRGRNQWNGMNTHELPVETQRHIVNARLGAQEAEMLDAQLKVKALGDGGEVMTAKASDTRG